MRLAKGVHVEWVEDEAVVLDPSTGQLHYLNPSAALVLALIEEHGLEEGLERLQVIHTEAQSDMEDISRLLDEMKEKGLLVDD